MNPLRLCLYAVLALLAAPAVPAFAAPARPNIIFILTDDQGYGDLARHGHPLLKTPHTDRLHDESVRFDNFYVSPSCSPTRAALLTGMHEFRNGVTHTMNPREHLYLGATILPQLLGPAGYRNGFVGKWHLAAEKDYDPCRRGFEWCSTNTQGPHEHFDPEFVVNGVRSRRQGYREDLFFDDAMTFIEESGEQPFFLYLSTYSPHDPLDAPPEFVEPFLGHVDEKRAKYLGMVANIDYNVGRLLKFLEERELDEDTIIIFMNDNGQTWGLDVYNADMRGCKCTIWHGGSRAMSFWRWPGRWKPHTVENLTAHLDVLPTLCELAGAEIPADLRPKLEGFSLRPLLEADGPAAWPHDDRLLFQHVARWPSGLAASHKYAMAGVRQGNYLLLRSRPCDDPACTSDVFGYQCATLRMVEKGQTRQIYTDENAAFHWGISPPDRWALFDTRLDPACGNDLAADQPALVSALADAYDRWWDDMYPDMVARGGEAELAEVAKKRRAQPLDVEAGRARAEAIARKTSRLLRLDADADGQVTPDEFLRRFEGRFTAMDRDRNGSLGPEELRDDTFEEMDADQDGQVTREEYDGYHAGEFEALDVNGDGFLDAGETASP